MSTKRDEKAWAKIDRDLRQAASWQSLSQGGLPAEAAQRLEDILADKHAPFSANLSVNEFLTSRSTGYMPVAQVSGTSMFHLGWQTMPTFSSGELTKITEAQASLRTLAVSRIQQEARVLKADGVIGVKKESAEYDWANGLIQFTLVGTAIKLPRATINPHPFVSTLTGQEFWSLYNAGYFPVGYGYGNSVYYQVATPYTRSAMGEEQLNEWDPASSKWFNQELTDFTDAIDTARRNAELRLQTDLVNLQANGIIDVDFSRKIRFHERHNPLRKDGTDMSVAIEITGTAITQLSDRNVPQIDYRIFLT